MLGDVHVKSGASIEIFDIFFSVKLELVYHRQFVIFRIIEIGTVHVVLRRNEITVFLIPFVILARKILSRDKFGIEHALLCPVLAVRHIDGLEKPVHELLVLFVRADFKSEELGGIGHSVHAYGQILSVHINEAGTIDIEHICLEEVLDDFVESSLILVHTLRHLADFIVYECVEFGTVVFQLF